MIKKIDACINIQGNKFSPAKAQEMTGLIFSKTNEPGDIGKTGKYKNKPLPYGFAVVEPSVKIDDHKKIKWLADTIKDKVKILKSCGAEDLYFYIGYFYENQCNLALSNEELKSLAETGLDYWFSCYDIGDENEK